MLMPKKTKYRKMQRGRRKGLSKGAREIAFGQFGLEAVEPGWLTAAQIEAARLTITKKLKKVGEFYVRVFPDKPISKKPAETRMGKGKGNPEFWVSVVKKKRIIFEIAGLSEQESKALLRSVSYKLPIKTRFVKVAEITNQE